MINSLFKKLFGSVNDRVIKNIAPLITQINSLESSLVDLSDSQLQEKTIYLQNQLSAGQTLDQILPLAFAVVREASKRVLNMRHFDVQLIGGVVLHQGKIAEMGTGEGKTLVATLPTYLNALTNQGVHIVTVNDYLAKRDSEWMGKIHRFLGLTVGCLTHDLNDSERKNAYQCHITYATNNELGFDYLRDNMKYSLQDMVQRRNFAIVDEVDSILIDEARTPLIISGQTNNNSQLYQQVNSLISFLKPEDFQIEEKEKSVFITEKGIENIESLLKKQKIIANDSSLYEPNNIALVHHLNQALKAHHLFKNETDYIVKDNSVIIIDEFTGRMQEGRRFSDGLHQALEAKEGLKIRNENQTLASISFQNYFRLYNKLAGMTGTASNEAVEFEETYNLSVVSVPPHKPITRKDFHDEIYKNTQAKHQALVKAVTEAHQKQQPVLLGTVSIEKSEIISKLLAKHNLPHQVLNAKDHAKEAEIIAKAGKPKAITIATNMAGRGTDIMLGGNPEVETKNYTDPQKITEILAKVKADKQTVIDAGGLLVIGTERHESRRIDDQLRGRAGRQGDIGVSRFLVALDDDLMRIFYSEKMTNFLSNLSLPEDEPVTHTLITKSLKTAQKKVETHNYEIRKNLLKFDDIINFQRKNIYQLRNNIISQNDVLPQILQYSNQIILDLCLDAMPKNSYPEQWLLSSLDAELFRIYSLKLNLADLASQSDKQHIITTINKAVDTLFAEKISSIGSEIFIQVAKQIFLTVLDGEWKDHLLSLDKLRQGINLRAYAQKDPFIEYKKEAFSLYEDMMLRIEENVVAHLSHVQITKSENSSSPEVIKDNTANKKTKNKK